MKKRQTQAEQIRSIATAIKKQDKARREREAQAEESSDEGDDSKLRRRPFAGKLQ